MLCQCACVFMHGVRAAELFVDCWNATSCVSGFAINNANRVPASGETLALPIKDTDRTIDIAVWTGK